MHIDDLRSTHDELCNSLHNKAVEMTNSLVDEAYEVFNSNAFDFSVPASRNIYQSSLYSNILNYLLVIELWKTNQSDVTLDSRALYGLLKSYAKKNRITVKVSLNNKVYFKELLKVPYRFLRVLRKMLRIRKYAKQISCSLQEVRSVDQSILVDTYLLNGSFSQTGYHNRYFGSFFDFFSTEEKKRTFIVPNFLPANYIPTLAGEIAEYSKSVDFRVFCKESLLSASDYWQVVGSWVKSFTLGFKRTRNPLLRLVKEELRLKAFSEITFESLVGFIFFKKLRKAKLSISSLISWNENHLYNRSMVKGHKVFSLPFKFVAYQGVVLDFDHDFFLRPTDVEVRRGLFPPEVYLAGQQIYNEISYGNGVKVLPAPVYRLSSYLNVSPAGSRKKGHVVLVGLSLVPDLAEEILGVAEKLAKQLPNYEFKIRCHPLLPMILPGSVSNMSIDSEKNVAVTLEKASLFIGTGSALILEAAMMEVPTLIVRKKGEHVQNPLPPKFRELFSATVTSDSDLNGSFEGLVNVSSEVLKQRRTSADMIYSAYVKPIGRENFEGMIG